jgi:hypothetical protein
MTVSCHGDLEESAKKRRWCQLILNNNCLLEMGDEWTHFLCRY